MNAPYRAPVPVLPDPHLVAWRDLRRRRAMSRLFVVLFVPAGLVALRLDGALPALLFWLVGGTSFATALHLDTFECPHCHDVFRGRKWLARWGRFQSQCAGCGIAIGTPKELAAGESGYPLPSAPSTVGPASAPPLPASPADDPETVSGGAEAP